MNRSLTGPALLLGVLSSWGCALEGDFAMGDGLSAALPGTLEQAATTICADGPTTKGIDVSKYQGTIDWDQVKDDGVVFAIIRVSDGTGYYDPQFDRNWAEAQRVGVIRGVYQFWRTDDDPTEQAQLVLDHMGALEPGDLPPTMDIETDDGIADIGVRLDRMRTWMEVMREGTGADPMIYGGRYSWAELTDNTTEFNNHTLWHAQYTSAACPTIATGWDHWNIWQHSSTGRVQGIGGGNSDVDMNRFNGDQSQLDTLRVGPTVCGDGRCTGDEDHDACASDCPICEPLPAAGGVVDEGGLCFEGGGPQQYLRQVDGTGNDDGLIWTHTTSSAAEANFGTWNLRLAEAGHYRVEAYTEADYAQSRQANYVVHHDGIDDDFLIDQTAADGWTPVAADLVFTAGDGQFVHLADNTGEPGTTQLVFDALRLTRLDASEGEGEGEGEGEEGEGDDGGEGEGEGEGEGPGIKRVVIQNVHDPAGCATVPMALPATLVVLALGRRRRLWPAAV